MLNGSLPALSGGPAMAVPHPYSMTTLSIRTCTAALAAVLLLSPIFSFGQNPRQVLHSFGGGRLHLNAPVAGSDGTIFDTTYWGGSHDCGTFSAVSPQGQVATLYEFGGYDGDGRNPNSPVAGADGNYYGVTAFGGANGFGTVFRITPAGVESILHSFSGGVSDGAHPVGTLVIGTDGSFYGVTSEGGPATTRRPYGVGVVFKITAQGQESVMAQFSDPSDFALAAIAAHPDGNLYALQNRTDGTTSLLRINPQGVSSELYRSPSLSAPLIVGPDSNLYCLNPQGVLKATTTGTPSQAAVSPQSPQISAMAFAATANSMRRRATYCTRSEQRAPLRRSTISGSTLSTLSLGFTPYLPGNSSRRSSGPRTRCKPSRSLARRLSSLVFHPVGSRIQQGRFASATTGIFTG